MTLLPFLNISAGVEVEKDENNKNVSLGEKDTTSANTKVLLWQFMIMWCNDPSPSLTRWWQWPRSRTGTGWCTPRGWCWWTSTAAGAGPAPPWRLTSRDCGWPPSWPMTGSASPAPVVTILKSSLHSERIPDQHGIIFRRGITRFLLMPIFYTVFRLFLSSGIPTALLRGANRPLLTKLFHNELTLEREGRMPVYIDYKSQRWNIKS